MNDFKLYQFPVTNKNLDRISKNNKFELFVNFDNSGFDFLSEEDYLYANASVSLKSLKGEVSNNYLILNKSDYQKLRKSLVDLQKKINKIMNKFVEETKDLFYNKKKNLNKFNNLALDIKVA